MKRLPTLWLAACILSLSQLFSVSPANAQTFTAVPNANIDAACNGFYIYLPAGYTTAKKYPFLLAIHGAGENGNGTSNLPSLLGTGMPALINGGKFPSSFTVNGSTYQFIVVMPQFNVNPSDVHVQAVITYIEQHYSVDFTRLYLTGYSQGGGNIWYYAGVNPANTVQIAAMVPVAGSVQLQSDWAQTIASNNVPILATHNMGDGTIPYTWTTGNISLINNSHPPPSPLAIGIIFPGGSHDSWDYTYDPLQFTYNGMSIYEWMLQYTRGSSAALPVTLGAYTATLTGRNAVIVNWTTLTEINNQYFVLERSSDGINFTALGTIPASNLPNGHDYSFTDASPLAGNNYYRLSQIDADGHITYFNVLNVVVTSSQVYFRISPNPVSNYIQLELSHPEMGPVVVSLYDMQGRALQTWKFDKQTPVWQQSISIGNIAPGSYTIQLKGATLSEVQQFIKQ